jgi:putative inorganic carbon (HCO3(-)) transporter
MTARRAWLAVALLVVTAPVLVFPASLGPTLQWLAAVVATVALLAAVVLVSDHGHLRWYVGVLALTALVGWVGAADEPETVNHFSGLAFGLLAMATVGAWCRTRERLLLVTVLFLLSGVLAVSVGGRSTAPVHTSKAMFGVATTIVAPVTPLPLRSLHARTSVSRNALAATAMLVLPIALALALAPLRWSGLQFAIRLSALLAAMWAAGAVVVMQSRSAWLSAIVVAAIWTRAWMQPRLWWLSAGFLFLVAPVVLYVVWGDSPRAIEAIASLQGRVEIWEQGLQALRPSPWFGIGLDYFRHSGYSPILVWPDQIVGRPHAHNVFLQTALDVGLIGLAGYLAVIGYVMRRAMNIARSTSGDPLARHLAVGAALSLVSVHVYGLLDAVPLGAKIGMFQWLSAGLVLAISRMQAPAGSMQVQS